MGVYTYKVFRAVDPAELTIADHPLKDGLFHLVGEFKAKEPGLAALAAAEQVGQAGTYHPVPDRHFNDVPIVPTTGFMIGEPEDPAPPPAPPAGSGDDDPDLDPRLDQTFPCETDGCGHLPADHGAKGLGICRVEDCPCGGYLPAP